MKRIEQCRWRHDHPQAGRETTTGCHCTWDEIRIAHPEAVTVAETLRVVLVPETEEEHSLCVAAPCSAVPLMRR